jgi:hypothetical protein
MRIKSYFAPSVQSAIALARREFGDDVTLVTSHVAAPESRQLGEYEVVFAIEEPEPVAPPATEAEPEPPSPAPAFQDLLREAIDTKPVQQASLPQKLEDLRATFIEMGIEPPVVRALLTLIERSVSLSPVNSSAEAENEDASLAPSSILALAAKTREPESDVTVVPESAIAELIIPESIEPEPVEQPAASASSGFHFSPAELAFALSVSGFSAIETAFT